MRSNQRKGRFREIEEGRQAKTAAFFFVFLSAVF